MKRTDIKKSETINRYAQAILAVAAGEGMIDQVEEDLSLIKEALKGNDTLRQFLKNPQIAHGEKQEAAMEIFGSKVSGIVLQQIALVIGQNRGDLLLNIIDELFRLANESRRKKIGRITTAIPLPEAIERRLERVLSEYIGKVVILKNLVDPSILGGFILQIDEQIIDASIQGQLGRLREEISKEIPMTPQKRSPLYLENAGTG